MLMGSAAVQTVNKGCIENPDGSPTQLELAADQPQVTAIALAPFSVHSGIGAVTTDTWLIIGPSPKILTDRGGARPDSS